MEKQQHTIKCLACKSTNLCFGYLGTRGHTFVPSGIFTIYGYRTRSYLCLECGHIGQYIPVNKIQKLKEKMKNLHEEE